MSTRSRVSAALVLLAVTAALAGPGRSSAAGTAAAVELYPRADSWTVTGHGWGHGHGMSQVGADGAARKGLSAAAILRFYYPGTTLSAVGRPSITVRLSGDVGLTGSPSRSLDVAAAPGLSVTDRATGTSTPLPAGPLRWRVVPDGAGGLVLQSFDGTAWTGGAPEAGPLQFAVRGALLRRYYPGGSWREYRGRLTATATGGGLTVTALLSREAYLRSVVPGEVGAGARPAALQAQAVAARTYAAYKQGHATGGAQICDSTACQVFGGSRVQRATGGRPQPVEDPRSDAAVAATAGRVLLYRGMPAFTEFSASNGGWTVAGGPPYQVAGPDPYDGVTGSRSHTWTAVLTPAALESAFPAVGRLSGIRVVTRDGHGQWGGRVQEVVLEGRDGSGPTSVPVTGRSVYQAHPWPASPDGLRSSWWTVTGMLPGGPSGRLDPVPVTATGATVTGWALDTRALPTRLAVQVTADRRPAAGGAADRPRADLTAARPGAGRRHGFAFVLPLLPGPHRICLRALQVQLSCRSATVPGPSLPIGHLDRVTASRTGVRVQGWALDPNTAAALRVRLSLDGRTARTVTAAGLRPDVARAYPRYGAAHGFDVALAAPRGRHSVCVTALDVGPGTDRQIACRTVTTG